MRDVGKGVSGRSLWTLQMHKVIQESEIIKIVFPSQIPALH